jgi:hypothetical protein
MHIEIKNILTENVTTHTLSIQGIKVVDNDCEDVGSILPVLDVEICYYHMPSDEELLVIAKALVMAHKNIDSAYFTIETKNANRRIAQCIYDFSPATGKLTHLK